MSIESAITNAQGKVANAYTAISNKGGTLPATQNLSNMPTAISSIPEATEPTLASLTVTPSTTSQTLTPPSGTDGYNTVTVSAVTASIDSDIQAGNIRNGVNILGVTGNYSGSGSTPVIEALTVTPSTTTQTISVSAGTDGYSPVTVSAVTASIDSDIVASNIKSGVNILGVSGTVTALAGETRTVSITSTSGNTFTPSSGKNGITSIKCNPTNASLTITPTTTTQTFTVPTGYSGYGTVTCDAGGGGHEIGDIGIAPLGIDETQNLRRYVNGQVIIQDQFISFTNKLKRALQLYPSLVCTEAQWQATVTLSVGGQCGKFVIDDVAGTIRLPKIIMPIQGLTNLANLAKIVEAGLPNITGGLGEVLKGADEGGAFYNISQIASNRTYATGSYSSYNTGLDASLSSSIYGNSTTVQQEQIQYPYFIQVATGVEESVDVTREIELNNPFCLLDYKYSEYELDNISWLRSNGQWNAKAVFPDAYDLLLKIYNGTETKAGVSVKLSTETYADTDFVLNTSDETFRLPLKVALASGKAVVGNGLSLGLTDNSKNFGLHGNNGNYVTAVLGAYGASTGTSISSSATAQSTNSMGVTTDATKSGIELSDANLYLYFYVGETVQNANLINAGRIEEKLVDKADKIEVDEKLVDKADKIEVDGQWVNNYLELAFEVTIPTSTNTEYDISSYLPNDTYDYEVMLTGYVTTGAATGRFLNLPISTDALTNFVRVCAAQTKTNSSVVSAGSASVPVSTGRKIIVNAYTNYNGTYNLALVAYRRLGTNQ